MSRVRSSSDGLILLVLAATLLILRYGPEAGPVFRLAWQQLREHTAVTFAAPTLQSPSRCVPRYECHPVEFSHDYDCASPR